jgi:hypothetical protein
VSASSLLAWKLVADPLATQGSSGLINLQTYFSDIPAITDLDEDGDLDLLTYNALGLRVEYHQNQSMERFGHADSLVFKRVNPCWGRFEQGYRLRECYRYNQEPLSRKTCRRLQPACPGFRWRWG